MTESNAILRLENVGFQADGVTILNEINFNNVLFPQPEGPVISLNSPALS